MRHAEQPAAGDGRQRPLVPRARCLPRLSRSVRRSPPLLSRTWLCKFPVTTLLTLSQAMLQLGMIRSFKHKGLAELFERGRSRRVGQELQARCLRRLEALDQAESLTDLHVPGFNFHGLQGVPQRYSIHVNGPWCITFEWEDGETLRVDLEQYH